MLRSKLLGFVDIARSDRLALLLELLDVPSPGAAWHNKAPILAALGYFSHQISFGLNPVRPDSRIIAMVVP